MKTIKISQMFQGYDVLSTRFSGFEVRKVIEKELKNGNMPIILDFEGIKSISQSFGDEIVGVFIRSKGVGFVKENIKVINAESVIRTTLNGIVAYSKKMVQNSMSSSSKFSVSHM